MEHIPNLAAIAFTATARGLATRIAGTNNTSQSVLLATEDGGRTWRPVRSFLLCPAAAAGNRASLCNTRRFTVSY